MASRAKIRDVRDTLRDVQMVEDAAARVEIRRKRPPPPCRDENDTRRSRKRHGASRRLPRRQAEEQAVRLPPAWCWRSSCSFAVHHGRRQPAMI